MPAALMNDVLVTVGYQNKRQRGRRPNLQILTNWPRIKSAGSDTMISGHGVGSGRFYQGLRSSAPGQAGATAAGGFASENYCKFLIIF